MSMYRNEWICCGSVTETDGWDPDACPFCTPAAPAPVAQPDDPMTPSHVDAVDHAHEILRRKGYQRDGDFFVNVNRVGAEAMHVSTIATIVAAALIAAPRSSGASTFQKGK